MIFGRYVTYNAINGELTLAVGKLLPETLEHLYKAEKLEIKEVKEKRSLTANAYLWVLCTKIAEVVKSSKDEIYEDMLQKYGYVSDISITVKAEVDMSRIEGHWKYISTSSDGKWKAYLMIRGTSEYNRSEMSKFTDMVVQEAKDVGVETLPPHEIEKMLAMIGEKNGKG